MGTIRFRPGGEVAPDAFQGLAPPELHDVLGDELDATRRLYFPTAGEALELFEVRMDPGVRVRSHAHTAPEVIYVLDGSLSFGRRRCAPGDAVFIDAHTLYGFQAGDDGVRFLNFRGDPASRYLTPDQVVARIARDRREQEEEE